MHGQIHVPMRTKYKCVCRMVEARASRGNTAVRATRGDFRRLHLMFSRAHPAECSCAVKYTHAALMMPCARIAAQKTEARRVVWQQDPKGEGVFDHKDIEAGNLSWP